MSSVNTLFDYVQKNPDREAAKRDVKVVNLMEKKDPLLKKIWWDPCNDSATTHKTEFITGLPKWWFRILNQGTPPSTDKYAEATWGTTLIETSTKTDNVQLKIHGNARAQTMLMNRNKAARQSLTQGASEILWYSNTKANQVSIAGLSSVFGSTDGGFGRNLLLGNNGKYVIKGALTSSGNAFSSIWLINFSADGVHGIFPKNTTAGLEYKNKGVIEIPDDTNGIEGAMMEAYFERYQWFLGIAVEDPRLAVRACNIDTSTLQNDPFAARHTNSGVFLPWIMNDMLKLLDNSETGGRICWVMPTKVKSALDQQRFMSGDSGHTRQDVDASPYNNFQGHDIIDSEILLNTESLITA